MKETKRRTDQKKANAKSNESRDYQEKIDIKDKLVEITEAINSHAAVIEEMVKQIERIKDRLGLE